MLEVQKTLQIKILHLDDEIEILEIIQIYVDYFNRNNIEEFTIQLKSCLSAKEALNEIIFYRYDIIISDCMMPEKTGIKFLKELRTWGLNIPTILLTGLNMQEVKQLDKAQTIDFWYIKKNYFIFESLFDLISLIYHTNFKATRFRGIG